MPLSSWSQEIKTTRDIGLWASIGINYQINKKWETSINQELRTNSNFSKFKRSITDLGIAYEINKRFEIEGGLRYAYNRKRDNTYSHNLRYNVDFKFKSNFRKHFGFQYRFRYQSNYENPFTGFADFEQRGKTRNRIKLDYEKSKHNIYLLMESFREHLYYRQPSFHNLRFLLGDEYETKVGEFDLGLGYEVELNEKYPLNFFFLKIQYTINIERN